MTDFMRIQEVAERLGVGTRRAYRMAARGEIPTVRHGFGVRVPRAAWDAFIADQTQAAMRAMKESEKHNAHSA